MSRVVFTASMSLDGLIAGPGGDMTWLAPFTQPDPVADELAAQTGALLIGARTFFGDDPHAGTDAEGAFGGTWQGPQVVLTHTPREPRGDVVFVDDLHRAHALATERAGDGLVCVLGADVARQLLRAGLLDEVLVFVVPVLLGDGVPLFRDPGGQQVLLDPLPVHQGPAGTALRFRVRR